MMSNTNYSIGLQVTTSRTRSHCVRRHLHANQETQCIGLGHET